MPFTGIAWRYEFSAPEQNTFTLNCKEYIGSAVDLYIQSKHDKSRNFFPCYLNRSNSTSTIGWLRKSNHDPDKDPIHNMVARWHAFRLMIIAMEKIISNIKGLYFLFK